MKKLIALVAGLLVAACGAVDTNAVTKAAGQDEVDLATCRAQGLAAALDGGDDAGLAVYAACKKDGGY